MRKHFAQKLFIYLGHDLFKLSRALGHSSIATTMIYLHISQKTINSLSSPLDGVLAKSYRSLHKKLLAADTYVCTHAHKTKVGDGRPSVEFYLNTGINYILTAHYHPRSLNRELGAIEFLYWRSATSSFGILTGMQTAALI